MKKGGRKKLSEESIYRQAERFERELKEIDEKRDALMASIPEPVRDLMAVAGKLQKRQVGAPPPEATPEPPAPRAPVAPKANGKSNGAAAQA